MPELYGSEEMDSDDEDYPLEEINDNYIGRYIIDINYNRPLKNFPSTLNKIEEVDESSIKSPEAEGSEGSDRRDENGNSVEEGRRGAHVAWNPHHQVISISDRKVSHRQRPKSASSVPEEPPRGEKENPEKRPKSSCAAYPSKIPVKKKTPYKKYRSDSECSSGLSIDDDELHPYSNNSSKTSSRRRVERSQESIDEFVSFCHDYPLRPKSACCIRRDDLRPKKLSNKRSNSQPNITRDSSPQPRTSWSEISRFRRSLRLLGLSSSDFGYPDSPKEELPPRPRSSAGPAPTFSTRIVQRSISLECLREVVRESASEYLYTGLPQRRLLAQAAYEEWYFKKNDEAVKRLQEEKEIKERVREALEMENERRREKAGEHYQKWIQKKKSEARPNTNMRKRVFGNKLIKSKEEIDKAYLEWKKKKEELAAGRRNKEEVDNAETERARKEEKRKQAEKVFCEWKKKLEVTERIKRAKEKKAQDKLKEQLTARSKATKTFQTWKEQKDQEREEKTKTYRASVRRVQDDRSMALTERQYVADQAFQNWLEKLECRTRKPNPATKIPWAPS